MLKFSQLQQIMDIMDNIYGHCITIEVLYNLEYNFKLQTILVF